MGKRSKNLLSVRIILAEIASNVNIKCNVKILFSTSIISIENVNVMLVYVNEVSDHFLLDPIIRWPSVFYSVIIYRQRSCGKSNNFNSYDLYR